MLFDISTNTWNTACVCVCVCMCLCVRPFFVCTCTWESTANIAKPCRTYLSVCMCGCVRACVCVKGKYTDTMSDACTRKLLSSRLENRHNKLPERASSDGRKHNGTTNKLHAEKRCPSLPAHPDVTAKSRPLCRCRSSWSETNSIRSSGYFLITFECFLHIHTHPSPLSPYSYTYIWGAAICLSAWDYTSKGTTGKRNPCIGCIQW